MSLEFDFIREDGGALFKVDDMTNNLKVGFGSRIVIILYS